MGELCDLLSLGLFHRAEQGGHDVFRLELDRGLSKQFRFQSWRYEHPERVELDVRNLESPLGAKLYVHSQGSWWRQEHDLFQTLELGTGHLVPTVSDRHLRNSFLFSEPLEPSFNSADVSSSNRPG